MAPRLLAAFGSQRERYRSADEIQSFSGIAPLTEASGKRTWVHFRWACPTASTATRSLAALLDSTASSPSAENSCAWTSRPHSVRNLMAPRESMALVAGDVTGAEDWLAAGFSGDPELMRTYSCGADPYMEFAAVTGAVLPGTIRDKNNKELEIIRAQHKTAKLAIQYGVGGETLRKYLGVPLWKAQYIVNRHKQAYAVYWQWVDDQVKLAEERGYVETDFGWRQSIEHMNFNSILNFPQQAGCAELLRCACNLLVDAGWGYALAAPHHDALYMHVETMRAEECKTAVADAFIEAGHIIMGLPEFPLRVHAEVVHHPNHYHDADGVEIWDIVCEHFGWDKFAVVSEEKSEEPLPAYSS